MPTLKSTPKASTARVWTFSSSHPNDQFARQEISSSTSGRKRKRNGGDEKTMPRSGRIARHQKGTPQPGATQFSTFAGLSFFFFGFSTSGPAGGGRTPLSSSL